MEICDADGAGTLQENARAVQAGGPRAQMLHVWYIYLHVGHVCSKCRHIFHTWSTWDGLLVYNPLNLYQPVAIFAINPGEIKGAKQLLLGRPPCTLDMENSSVPHHVCQVAGTVLGQVLRMCSGNIKCGDNIE